MGHKLITQIVLVVISLVIVFTFIKPSFGSIGEMQDELLEFRTTVEKAKQLNMKLNELLQKESRFSQQELSDLDTYLPSYIDQLKVMRDISNIFSVGGVEIVSLLANEEVVPVGSVVFENKVIEGGDGMSYQEFDIVFNATYGEMKGVLLLLESNSYPLEITKFSFDANPLDDHEVLERSDLKQYSLTVRVYALTE